MIENGLLDFTSRFGRHGMDLSKRIHSGRTKSGRFEEDLLHTRYTYILLHVATGWHTRAIQYVGLI
jgi:hypothetical protein